jgi:hypothetical protein
MPTKRGRTIWVRAALDRPKLWRFTAALSALLLCGLLIACAQGSLTIVGKWPRASAQSAAVSPSWVRWCTKGVARQDRRRIAFCARAAGRVIGFTHGPNPQEAHVGILSDFHFVIVLLPEGTPTPTIGTRIVAIGPLLRARDGQRELQAFRIDTA